MISLTTRQRLELREQELDSAYAEWEDHHKEVQQYILPHRGLFNTSERRGSKKHRSILDGHATTSAEILSAGMMSGLTRPTHPWFRMTDPGVQQDGEEREWLEHATEAVRDLFTRSNLYQSLPALYKDAGGFGVSTMTVQPEAPTSMHTYVHPCGSYRIDHDTRWNLTTFHNVTPMTIIQIIERWGEGVLPQHHRDLARDKRGLLSSLDVKQTITENRDYDPTSKSPLKRRFLQHFWISEEHAPNDGIFEARGHNWFPVIPARWELNGMSPYGYGPGMNALADVKMLQRLKGKALTSLDKGVDPTMMAPTHLRTMGGVEHRPAAVTYYDASLPNARIEAQHVPDPAWMQNALLVVEDVKQQIDRSFHTDLFRILADITNDRQVTAYHVSQLVGERNTQLGPVLERFSADTIDKLVEAGYEIARDAGLIDDPPASLEGIELRVEYLSIIAQAQKLDSARGLQATAEYALSVAPLSQEVPIAFDAVEALRQIAEINGVPEGVIRSVEEVAELARQQAQEAQRQAAIEAAPQLAGAAASASNIDPENIESLARAVGGAAA